jgi:hypothetical protein
MATFKEANQVRVSLKMKLSNYSWYASSAVVHDNGDYIIEVAVKELNNTVRKTISPVVDGVAVKTVLE